MQATHTQQQAYVIVPVRDAFLERARNHGLDDQHQPVEKHIAEGGEPLRDALRRARPGEHILLASYCPFGLAGPFKEYGPIYILASPDPSTSMPGALPLGDDGAYIAKPFVLRAYSASERIVDAVVTSTDSAEDHLQAFLRRDDVHFVLARFASYGCYACRIERA